MRATPAADDVSIPVVVDDIKRINQFPMTRCTYFSVECERPSPDWMLVLPELGLPFLMLGLSGIVTRPSEDHPIFDSVGSFERFYTQVEQREDLYVDTNDVWLPNSLFGGGPVRRGDVFRIGVDLFLSAQSFRYDVVDVDGFLKAVRKQEGKLQFSPDETRALHDWTWQNIELIKCDHDEKPGRKLDRLPKEGV